MLNLQKHTVQQTHRFCPVCSVFLQFEYELPTCVYTFLNSALATDLTACNSEFEASQQLGFLLSLVPRKLLMPIVHVSCREYMVLI